MTWADFSRQLLQLNVCYRKLIIRAFQIFYVILSLVALLAAYAEVVQSNWSLLAYSMGLWSGNIALLLFIITILPGMFRRFRLRFVPVTLITTYRRYVGIGVFLFAFIHFLLVRFIISSLHGLDLSLATFEIFGACALGLLLPLFLTSNDFSMRILGPWWKKIHSAVYVIGWLIFGHVALQGQLWQSALIGLAAASETISFLWKYIPQRPAE